MLQVCHWRFDSRLAVFDYKWHIPIEYEWHQNAHHKANLIRVLSGFLKLILLDDKAHERVQGAVTMPGLEVWMIKITLKFFYIYENYY